VLLHLLIFIPLVAALAILLGAPARKTALVAGGASFLLSVFALLSYDKGAGGFQLRSTSPIVPEWGLHYSLGADGLSLVMLFLTGIVTLAAVWVTPRIEQRESLFYACILFIAAGAAGAFASLDLFFLYAFHELALIPTFLLLGLWGSGERQTAAWKITIYLALGSFVLLIGLVDMYFSIPEAHRTFDLVRLQQLGAEKVIPADVQARPYLFLLIGFGILISLFPFHSWAPQAYASAPAPAAMLHAGVLKKFGLYGLIRVALPLLPEGAKEWAWLLLILLVGNILYVGLVTIGQKRLDLMLGYSSVMHMGYIFLGIGAMNVLGVSGASLLMLAHGLSIAALFAMTGVLREKRPTLMLDSFGGVGKSMPWLAAAFGCAAFASIGLPGFANFASEVLVFFGAFRTGAGVEHDWHFQLATIFALWGVVISAVYMLRAYRAIFMGEPARDTTDWTDVAKPARWPVTLLLAVLLLAGFAPKIFLSYVQPSVQALLVK
jgi:NADH-quinone oxidoreductase subunit M